MYRTWRRWTIWLTALCALGLTSCASWYDRTRPSPVLQYCHNGIVTSLASNNVLVLDDGTSVHLWGIDGKSMNACTLAMDFLAQNVLGKRVYVVGVGQRPAALQVDLYVCNSTLPSDCRTSGTYLNLVLVARGLAAYEPSGRDDFSINAWRASGQPPFPVPLASDFRRAEQQAQKDRVGLWAAPQRQQDVPVQWLSVVPSSTRVP